MSQIKHESDRLETNRRIATWIAIEKELSMNVSIIPEHIWIIMIQSQIRKLTNLQIICILQKIKSFRV